MLFLSDGLGDSSDHTGFFMYTKQGQIQRETFSFDGITPNQTVDILVDNCNNTDVWLNNIDPITEQIIVGTELNSTSRIGEWEEVDLANSQNIVFNTNPNRNKYEVETLDRDRFRIIFGDGKFAAIPSGMFEVWFRSSANAEYVIPVSAIQNVSASFGYMDKNNKRQTITVLFSLVDPIQNAAPTEDIESIRRIAPSVYYTQDRMVNNKDYNEFLLQDNSILKMKALNRTFAGDSKYVYWQDPRNFYENVKLFAGNIQAAGVGLTLTAADTVAFLELPWTPGELSQSTDRLHRIGQTAECVSVNYLVCDKTIDTEILTVLRDKEKTVMSVLDGAEYSGENTLDELLGKYF
jgi:hypothetical protein